MGDIHFGDAVLAALGVVLWWLIRSLVSGVSMQISKTDTSLGELAESVRMHHLNTDAHFTPRERSDLSEHLRAISADIKEQQLNARWNGDGIVRIAAKLDVTLTERP